jgi:hypothetical protein
MSTHKQSRMYRSNQLGSNLLSKSKQSYTGTYFTMKYYVLSKYTHDHLHIYIPITPELDFLKLFWSCHMTKTAWRSPTSSNWTAQSCIYFFTHTHHTSFLSKGSRDNSEIPPRCPQFTNVICLWTDNVAGCNNHLITVYRLWYMVFYGR